MIIVVKLHACCWHTVCRLQNVQFISLKLVMMSHERGKIPYLHPCHTTDYTVLTHRQNKYMLTTKKKKKKKPEQALLLCDAKQKCRGDPGMR